MKVEVVYTSYRRDLTWLYYSLRLLYRYFKADDWHVTVRLNEDCRALVGHWEVPVTWVFVEPWKDTYNFHMYLKSISDTHTEADLLILLDSDHMLLEPMTLDFLLEDGKPIVRYRDWDEDPNNSDLQVGRRIWGPPVERTLGVPLDREYMVGPPFVYWRDTFGHMRNRVEEFTGLPFYDVLYSDRVYDYRNFLNHPMRFCDYEALGLYATHFEPGRYALKHHPIGTTWPIRVFWSHDWSYKAKQVLEEALAR